LATLGETIDSEGLVRSTLSGFRPKGDVFVDEIIARENLPSWDRLWDYCVQEETMRHSKTVGQHDGKDDEENFSLAIEEKK